MPSGNAPAGFRWSARSRSLPARPAGRCAGPRCAPASHGPSRSGQRGRRPPPAPEKWVPI
jgi:hypothetical protein